jgi:hypothetical protein
MIPWDSLIKRFEGAPAFFRMQSVMLMKEDFRWHLFFPESGTFVTNFQ